MVLVLVSPSSAGGDDDKLVLVDNTPVVVVVVEHSNHEDGDTPEVAVEVMILLVPNTILRKNREKTLEQGIDR